MAKAELIYTKIFQPVSIEVTLETKEELDLFGSIFNYVPICDMLQNSNESAWCKSIRDIVEEAGGHIHLIHELDNACIRRVKSL